MLKKKIRLNHYLSYCGITSRRNADKLIQSGIIEVNGQIITQLGTKINSNDIVKCNGEKVKIKNRIYLMLNKPKGFITTTKDELERKTIMDLIPNFIRKQKIYPVGRLDYLTTGIIILTNDGYISEKLAHPKYQIQKVYRVSLDKDIQNQDFLKIKKGNIYLREGKVTIKFITKLKKNEIKIGLSIGWNRIIKRIFGKLNYKVINLDRISFGKINKKNMKLGEWRFLQKNELTNSFFS